MLADRLKELRKEIGMTQVELAEKLGVSKGTVAMWETGRRTPEYQNINRLSEIFCKRMNYLLGFSDDVALPSEKECEQAEKPQNVGILVFLLPLSLLKDEAVQSALKVTAAVNVSRANEMEVRQSGSQ